MLTVRRLGSILADTRHRWLGGSVVGLLVACASHGMTAQHQTLPPVARAACDLGYSFVRDTPGIRIERRTGLFGDEALPRPVLGCRLALRGSFARTPDGRDATVRLREGFAASGWEEMGAYSADGKDGTAFAFRRADVACLVRGRWDGGADGTPPIPEGDAYRVLVLCTSPAPPADRTR